MLSTNTAVYMLLESNRGTRRPNRQMVVGSLAFLSDIAHREEPSGEVSVKVGDLIQVETIVRVKTSQKYDSLSMIIINGCMDLDLQGQSKPLARFQNCSFYLGVDHLSNTNAFAQKKIILHA